MRKNLDKKLISKWKIIFGIIVYIVMGEVLKDVVLFPWVEPFLTTHFSSELAERLSELSEYLLLALLLIPTTIFGDEFDNQCR